MRADWTAKHVIVTGGSEGIGAAIAEAFANRQAHVSIIARREAPLRACAERLGADWIIADVTHRDELAKAIAELEARNGPCDVMACCAGLALPGRFLEVDTDEFDLQINANYVGSVNAIRPVLSAMVKRGQGHILLVSSTAAFLGIPGYTSYGPTKASVRQLALCLRYEVEPAGVLVSVLYPADTDTPGLAHENSRKPPETKAITSSISPLSPTKVAKAALHGLEHRKHHIAIDPLTRFFLLCANFPDDFSRPYFRHAITKALKTN